MEMNRGILSVGWLGPLWACVAVAALALCTQARAQQITAGLQITSPASGTVVHDTVPVTVVPLAGVNPSFVGLLAQFPIEVSGCASQPCYQFTLTVPATVDRARLYSINAIGAVGASGAGSVVASGAENLNVEPSAAITSLNVSLPFLVFVFHHAGSSSPLMVRGGFADGTYMDITESTGITYTSSDTNVATVIPEGVVTAVGTGCGAGGACVGVGLINVQYGGKTVIVQVSTSALKDATPPTKRNSFPAANAAGAARQKHASLRITSPPDGTIVHPGEMLTVRVRDEGKQGFRIVGLTGGVHFPPPDLNRVAPPWDFTFIVPQKIPAAGKYRVVASGVTTPGHPVYSPSIYIDIEPSEAPASLKTSGPMYFSRVGEYLPLSVTALFAHAPPMDVTRSTRITLASTNPVVAAVDANGIVTAKGTGTAQITIRFGGKTAIVPVSVTLAAAVPHSPAPWATGHGNRRGGRP